MKKYANPTTDFLLLRKFDRAIDNIELLPNVTQNPNFTVLMPELLNYTYGLIDIELNPNLGAGDFKLYFSYFDFFLLRPRFLTYKTVSKTKDVLVDFNINELQAKLTITELSVTPVVDNLRLIMLIDMSLIDTFRVRNLGLQMEYSGDFPDYMRSTINKFSVYGTNKDLSGFFLSR